MPLVRYRMFGGENIPARAMVENMVEWNATLNNSIFETFYFDQSKHFLYKQYSDD